jgi:tetratricopeptide (TPR) repeat protein
MVMNKIFGLGALLSLCLLGFIGLKTAASSDLYPYKSEKFGILLDDSYNVTNQVERKEFYDWMNKAYFKSGCLFPGKEKLSFDALLDDLKRDLSKLPEPLDYELKILVWLHKLIKTIIPKFSLARGFEFSNIVKLGERQCLSQSILMAAILQKIGIEAGVIMVYRNPEGQESNNGHAVVLVKLTQSKNVMLDASHKEPFVYHLGIFAKGKEDYCYLEPVFETGSHYIIAFDLASGEGKLDPEQVAPLDYNFVRSQLYFYRGERVPGGLIEGTKTEKGLKAAADYLKKSVALCPHNPLAVYYLSLVYQALGKTDKANKLLTQAYNLYCRYGWVPEGINKAINSNKQ